MRSREGESRSQFLRRADRRAMVALIILIAISAIVTLLDFQNKGDLTSMINVIVGMMNISLIIVGILVWTSRGEMGLIPTSRFFRWSVPLALIMGVFLTAYYTLFQGSIWIGIGEGVATELFPNDPVTLLIMYILVSFGVWGGILGFTSIGFGVVWVTTMISGRLIPWVLRVLKGFTGEGNDPIVVKIVAWATNAPDVLDASKLGIDGVKEERRFPRKGFITAIGWELLIGMVVAIYFSLNPIVYENIGLVGAMTILGVVSIIIPAIVIPWFVLVPLNARIPGVKRDFLLFNGIRSRILQTFVALGTLALLIRLALRELRPWEVLGEFVYYFFTLSLLATLFTFVYFNYFEYDLAGSIHERFVRSGKD